MLCLLVCLSFVALGAGLANACATGHLDAERLAGRWAWIHTIDFVGGEAITPETEGYAQEWVLRPDGSYSIITDGTVTETGTWCVEACVPNEENGAICTGQDVITLHRNIAAPEFQVVQSDYWFCGDVTCAPISGSDPPDSAIQVSVQVVDAPLSTFEWVARVPTQEASWTTLKTGFSPRR
jgi:hypothetical protein